MGGYAPLRAVPGLRLSLLLPELRRLAGRSPFPQAAGCCHHCGFGMRSRQMPALPGGEFVRRHRPRRRTPGGRSAPRCFRRRGCWCCRPISSPPSERPARGARRRRRRPLRHRHRYAIGRQGPSFSQAQSGRHRRRRSRLEQRRPARRRAHLSAAASGGRPRRPRRRHRPWLSANPSARASGDAGADRAGPRGVLRRRDRSAATRGISAVGRLAGASSSPARTATTPHSFARALARAAPPLDDVRVLGPADAPLALVRGRHRLRLLVKAPRGFICRHTYANGLPLGRSPRARSSSTSTSTRRAVL